MNSNLEKFKERLKNIEENRHKKKTEPQGLGIGMKIRLDLISPIINEMPALLVSLLRSIETSSN